MNKRYVLLMFLCFLTFIITIVISIKAFPNLEDEIETIDTDAILPTSITNYKAVRKDGKIAIFTKTGTQLTDYLFDQVYASPFKNEFDVPISTFPRFGYILVRKDHAYTILNKKCQEVVPFGTYDFIAPMNLLGYSLVKKNGQWGILDKDLKVCLPLEYDSISIDAGFYNHNDYSSFLVLKNKKYWILDPQTKWTLRLEFDEVGKFANNSYFATIGKKHYLINDEGRILSDEYDALYERKNGFIAKKSQKMGLISYKNVLEAPFEFDSILVSYDSHNFIALKAGKFGVIDPKGKTLIRFDCDQIEESWEREKDMIEHFIVQRNGKIGTVSVKDKVAIPLEYDAISAWVEHGPLAHYVRKDGKYGLVSYHGEVLIPCIYDALYYQEESRILCKKGDKFGIINSKNEEMLPCIYDVLLVKYPFLFNDTEPGRIVVRMKNVWNYLGLNGIILKANVPEKVVQKDFKKELISWDFWVKHMEDGLVRNKPYQPRL